MAPAARPANLLRLLPSLPILEWGRRYDRDTLVSDLVAAIIVTMMLIPQSLAYALLAGLPPEVGIYASIAPLVAYALFGTSSVLAVGPVAVASLMTASARSSRRVNSAAPVMPACTASAMFAFWNRRGANGRRWAASTTRCR